MFSFSQAEIKDAKVGLWAVVNAAGEKTLSQWISDNEHDQDPLLRLSIAGRIAAALEKLHAVVSWMFSFGCVFIGVVCVCDMI